ncbi:hypothetical protein [Kitasatospora sp. NPDC097691]|uniref:hypothetical protein n=1 Tax=Kitasatospora sp. NPDC097691 TaxID=3157231 RepID=UPI00332B0FAF
MVSIPDILDARSPAGYPNSLGYPPARLPALARPGSVPGGLFRRELSSRAGGG